MGTIRRLSTPHPTIDAVDLDIFRLRYFRHCMACTFCKDSCCQYGCDVNLEERERLLARAPEIEAFTGIPREKWLTSDVRVDAEYPGNGAVRTQVHDGACVFLSKPARGCKLHSFALAKGLDYHEVKPAICCPFPITWDQRVLRPASDVTDGLVCAGEGDTLYQGARADVAYSFGEALVRELDLIEAELARVSPHP